MISLKWLDDCGPSYQTDFSAGADLKARESVCIPAGRVVKVPTGVWIAKIDWEAVPKGFIPELQVRARSSLALKYGITLANAVGTIDADFPDEIQVLLWNFSAQDYTVSKGERIAQIVLNLTSRISDLNIGGKRIGGFGSTGKLDRDDASTQFIYN